MVVAILGAVPRAPQLVLQVARATYDPLDAVDITVRTYNGAPTPAVMRFGQTGEYALSLSGNGNSIWSSPVGGPTAHTRAFAPGYTTLVTYEWNGVLADGTAPSPGTYALRGTLLTSGTQATTATFVRITAPLPISALAKTGTQVVTVAGTLDAIGMTLHDASGDVKLARRIIGAGANATVDVRGSMAVQPDGTKAFALERWAPAATNTVALADDDPDVARGRKLASYVLAQRAARKALATAAPDLIGDLSLGDASGTTWGFSFGSVPDFAFFIDANVDPDDHGTMRVRRNPPGWHYDMGGIVFAAHDLARVRERYGAPGDDFAVLDAAGDYDVYLFNPRDPATLRAYRAGGNNLSSGSSMSDPTVIAELPRDAAFTRMRNAFVFALHTSTPNG